MVSPFPGMDPYLEGPTHWSDFHSRFIVSLADAINDRVPEQYIVRIGEYVVVEARGLSWPAERGFLSDVNVVQDRSAVAVAPPAFMQGVAAAVADAPAVPVTLENIEQLDDITETYVELRRLPHLEFVTVLEVLSPINKYGEGRGDYMRKRRELMRGGVNIVEIDLHRAGVRHEFAKPLPPADYVTYVWRAHRSRFTDLYPWTVRDRLPIIPIPLQTPERDVNVDLNDPFADAFMRGRYNRLIRADLPPPPPAFAPADAEWVRQTNRNRANPS